jgi:hypothetical protein
MTRDLQQLIEAAKKAAPSPEHREEQRRSFVFGNTAFENKLITREMVNQQATQIASEPHDRRK